MNVIIRRDPPHLPIMLKFDTPTTVRDLLYTVSRMVGIIAAVEGASVQIKNCQIEIFVDAQERYMLTEKATNPTRKPE